MYLFCRDSCEQIHDLFQTKELYLMSSLQKANKDCLLIGSRFPSVYRIWMKSLLFIVSSTCRKGIFLSNSSFTTNLTELWTVIHCSSIRPAERFEIRSHNVKQQCDEQARFHLFVIMPIHNIIYDLLQLREVIIGYSSSSQNIVCLAVCVWNGW